MRTGDYTKTSSTHRLFSQHEISVLWSYLFPYLFPYGVPYLFLIYFTSVLEEVFTKNIKLLDECGEVLSYLLA